MNRNLWLAGASLLAIVLGSGDANAVVFGNPGIEGFLIPSTGYYDFTVAGAQGGGSVGQAEGGFGAIVGGELFFAAGNTLEIVVGGAGGSGDVFNGYGGGGGGGSFVFGPGLLFAAGGGGGASFPSGGVEGGPGIGHGGRPAGQGSYGGGGGGGVPNPNPVVPGTPPQEQAQAGVFPFGGAAACCAFVGAEGGPSGGYGGGGGGGYNGGGGGGGAPGGSGSLGTPGGEGGFSYVIGTARNAFGITGGNGNDILPPANGYVSIDFVRSAVPEPSTWAMTLAGFAGLGWLARRRRHKTSPA